MPSPPAGCSLARHHPLCIRFQDLLPRHSAKNPVDFHVPARARLLAQGGRHQSDQCYALATSCLRTARLYERFCSYSIVGFYGCLGMPPLWNQLMDPTEMGARPPDALAAADLADVKCCLENVNRTPLFAADVDLNTGSSIARMVSGGANPWSEDRMRVRLHYVAMHKDSRSLPAPCSRARLSRKRSMSPT